MHTAVVYLAWEGAGTTPLAEFVASLAAHPTGIPYTLFVAWKGYTDSAALSGARRSFAEVKHEELTVSPDGLDLAAYRETAAVIPAQTICFLNTHSVILADGWLGLLSKRLAAPGVGLAGATGSYESPSSGAILPRRLLRRGRYPSFPNPHVRSNAFMLERETMLALRWPNAGRKEDAWRLESGVDGITRQIEGRGLAAVVVGRDGNVYPRERWPQSATFRTGEQVNLLVGDNRTRQYSEAGPRLRRRLTRLAWGDGTGAPALS